ncbi:SAM domain of BOI-like fungal subfamily protein [Aspergillus parasiticus SU-1]|uniref:SAM domain of BOI-like fungal subfamily protein n=1 Tax=Aspergillus parasiticus (strain ATCC 56775 / NRRL 5862 / SRRC 143 / SU-1) TaxID=1403190 RepID=A0A0F0IKU9_ASPPU|nr:SAM domain of BOI-like fungal subfamily protein [Aspergillus parasiticus SU-1]
MESLRNRRKAAPASLDVKNTAQFYPAWTVVKKRQSESTDFADTDFEYGSSDEESPRMSMGSLGRDSSSSLSTPELPTPDQAPNEPFSFQLDKRIKGPSGPHLFRSSIASYGSAPSTAEIDVYFERSPVQSQLAQAPYSGTQFSETPVTQSQFAPTATPSARSQFSEASSARSQFSETQTRFQYSEPPSGRSQLSVPESLTSSAQFSEAQRSRLQYSEPPSAQSQLSVPESSNPRTEFSETQSSRFQYSEPPSAQTYFSGTSSTRPNISIAETPNSRTQFSEPPTARSFYSETSSTRPQFSVAETPNSRIQFSEPPSAPSQFSETKSTRSQVSSENPYSRTHFTETPSSKSQFSAGEASMNRYQFSPCTPKAFATVHPDVSQVEESEIRSWMPTQVAHWMHIAGYDDYVIEKFMVNDITGSVLLSLQIDDLKELGIKSFGKRHQLMSSINHLRTTMRKTPDLELPIDHRRSYAMSVSPTGEVLSREAIGLDGSRQVVAGEAVSIVGIEQVLPKPHNCSKGENCPKYRKRQRQLEKLAAEFPDAVLLPGGSMLTGNPGNPDTAKNLLRPTSDAGPSIVASSDIFGPAQETPRLCEEALNEVQKLDPQESIRQFLNYQHVESCDPESELAPEPAPAPGQPAEPVPALTPPTSHTNNMAANLRNLPKLKIPTDYDSDELTTAVTTQRTITPSVATQTYGSPTVIQQYGPFSSMRTMDHYRQGTPFSEMDAPITAIPSDPVGRDVSQSVPPNMRYGNLMQHRQQRHAPRSAFLRPQPSPPQHRAQGRPLTPIEDPEDLRKRSPRIGFHNPSSSDTSLSSDPDVTKSGYMKKRKQARFLRHEWQDAHFTLRGTNLAMHKDELAAIRNSQALDSIDVDDYAVACSSLATSSKLTAAFKRSVLRSGNNISKDDAAFAFSLIPSTKENEKKALFGNSNVKSHHFAVKTRDERIDWMRELMLAKALKKGKECGASMQVNGNFI